MSLLLYYLQSSASFIEFYGSILMTINKLSQCPLTVPISAYVTLCQKNVNVMLLFLEKCNIW